MEEAVAKVPELFRSVLRERRSATPAKLDSPLAPAKQSGGGVLGGVFNKWVEDVQKGTRDRVKGWMIDWDAWCPAWVKSGAKTSYEWWTRERVHKLVENGVPNKDLDLVVFDCTCFRFRVGMVVDGSYSVESLCLRVVDGRSVRRRAEGYTQDSRSDG